MKKYFVALIALFLALVSYSTFAQSNLIPIPTSRPVFNPTPAENRGTVKPKPNLVSATVKGSLYVKKGDEKTQFRITVYKLVNNRWVNVNNFSTAVKPNGEYLTVIRGEGTYRFVPTVKFDPKFKYTFSPSNQTVRIREGANNAIFIRNFNYKKDNRK
jgi:hypothetical protein